MNICTMRMHHTTRMMIKACHTCARVMPHVRMSHVTHYAMHTPGATLRGISHATRHVINITAHVMSHTSRVMPHTWMR